MMDKAKHCAKRLIVFKGASISQSADFEILGPLLYQVSLFVFKLVSVRLTIGIPYGALVNLALVIPSPSGKSSSLSSTT